VWVTWGFSLRSCKRPIVPHPIKSLCFSLESLCLYRYSLSLYLLLSQTVEDSSLSFPDSVNTLLKDSLYLPHYTICFSLSPFFFFSLSLSLIHLGMMLHKDAAKRRWEKDPLVVCRTGTDWCAAQGLIGVPHRDYERKTLLRLEKKHLFLSSLSISLFLSLYTMTLFLSLKFQRSLSFFRDKSNSLQT